MSDQRTGNDSPQPRNPKDFKKPFLTWTEISCIVSATILAWAVSNVFFGRQEPMFSSREKPSAKPLNDVKLVELKGEKQLQQAQVQELMMMDDQLMKEAAKFDRRRDVPGEKESRRYRQKRTKILREQAELLLSEIPDGKIVEGTMEWEALKDMKTTLDDYGR